MTFLSADILNKTVPHVESCRIDSALIGDVYCDKVVPVTAYCYDEQYGYYVFEVIRKKTPLGERCYLNRTSVDLLETDTTQGISRVSCHLEWGTEIVRVNAPEYHDRDIVVVERSAP